MELPKNAPVFQKNEVVGFLAKIGVFLHPDRRLKLPSAGRSPAPYAKVGLPGPTLASGLLLSAPKMMVGSERLPTIAAHHGCPPTFKPKDAMVGLVGSWLFWKDILSKEFL